MNLLRLHTCNNNNYDGFQHLSFIFFMKIHFTIFKDYLMNETDPRGKVWGIGKWRF